MRNYLIHYSEIGLKRGNRGLFEEQLIRNIYRATRGLGVEAVKRLYGRVRLDQNDDGDAATLERRLERVYGIAHFDETVRGGLDLEPARATLAAWAEEGGFETFAVRTRRVNKQFPKTSLELNIEFGNLIQSVSGASVRLDHPDRAFHVLILNREIYLYHRRLPGAFGLPVGVSGRVALLLSGGIDSPVAGERLLRRGCELSFVHFHSAPFTNRASQAKAQELARNLCRDRFRTELFLVPLGELQRKIVADAPSAYRVILYRRYMLRLAERVARDCGCRALATGEAIGQVASQTIENLAVLDRTVELPILRPLIAMDKEEIIEIARQLGTYEISIEPDSDCCSYLLPRNPVTRARHQEVEHIERALDADELVEATLRDTERVEIGEE